MSPLIPILIAAAAKSMKSKENGNSDDGGIYGQAQRNTETMAENQIATRRPAPPSQPGPIMASATQPQQQRVIPPPQIPPPAQSPIAPMPLTAQNGQSADSYEQLRRLRGGF